jgi:hypothetical protein
MMLMPKAEKYYFDEQGPFIPIENTQQQKQAEGNCRQKQQQQLARGGARPDQTLAAIGGDQPDAASSSSSPSSPGTGTVIVRYTGIF